MKRMHFTKVYSFIFNLWRYVLQKYVCKRWKKKKRFHSSSKTEVKITKEVDKYD